MPSNKMKKKAHSNKVKKGDQNHSRIGGIGKEELKSSLQQEKELKQLLEESRQQDRQYQQGKESNNAKKQPTNSRSSSVHKMQTDENTRDQQVTEDENYSNKSGQEINISDSRSSDSQQQQLSLNDILQQHSQNKGNSKIKLTLEEKQQEASLIIPPYSFYIFSKLFELYSLTHQCFLSRDIKEEIYRANDKCFEMVQAQHELSDSNPNTSGQPPRADYENVILSSVKSLLEKMKYKEINVDKSESEQSEQDCPSSVRGNYAVFQQTNEFIQGPEGQICNKQLEQLSSGLEIKLAFSKEPKGIQKKEESNDLKVDGNDKKSAKIIEEMGIKTRYDQQEEFLKQFSEDHPFDESQYLKVQVSLPGLNLNITQEEGIYPYVNILNFESRDIQYLFDAQTKSVAFAGIVYVEEEFIITRILIQIDKLIASMLQMLDYFRFLSKSRSLKNSIVLEPIRLGFGLDRTFQAIEEQSRILLA